MSSSGPPTGGPSSFRPDRDERVDPEDYQLSDEPLAEGAPVDYRYAYELMEKRTVYEDERRRALDAKTATIIAGIVASLGLSLRLNTSLVASCAAATLLLPLITLFGEFRTASAREAPSAESIVDYYEKWPVKILREAIIAMMESIKENRQINDRKANLLDLGIKQTIICLIVILTVQIISAIRQGNLVP